MKVILLGSSGFIGKEVLNQCLNNPVITSIIALSRRSLPADLANPKLGEIIIDDFKLYPESVLEQLKDADACIWSMGTYNGDPVVELEYPEALREALLKVMDVKKKITYVYLGGAFTELDQEKTLWFLSNARHVRGLAQTQFLEFGKQHQNVKTYVVRPAGVITKNINALVRGLLQTVQVAVRTDELAVVMVDLAINGGEEEVVMNKAIIERGRELLKNQKQ